MSDLLTSVYLRMVNGINSVTDTSATPGMKSMEDAGQSTVSFQEILSEQVEELQELLQTEETSPLAELENTLDRSILGDDTLDLKGLSEEMLYSSGGSSVLANLMEGHFMSMVTATDETAEDESHLTQMFDDQGQNREQQIEQLLTNLQNTISKMGE
ncbi:MAG: hypothetical protein J6C06_02500 [Lachnospiraceae bacterium]|nr:hypothetical protein [Lachnospiraceae bacterium]